MIPGGTSIAEAMPLVRLSQNSLLRLILPVPESIVPRIHVGEPVEVRVLLAGAELSTGKVARFAERGLNRHAHDGDAKWTFRIPMLLVPGMYAEAVLTLEKRADALADPAAGCRDAGQRSTVYVVDAGSANRGARREARDRNAGKAEVLSGLKEGDLVVVARRSELRPGQVVLPKIDRSGGGEGAIDVAFRDSQSLLHRRYVSDDSRWSALSSLVRMPVDMFPTINIPVVVVATFYSGMPPEQIETDITSRFERFFTLASGIDHIESRSLPGVSVIKVYFQPGTNADSAVTTISNLAMAQLRRLPPGTLPPVVLKFDASSLPVCLVTFKGRRAQGDDAARSRAISRFATRSRACRARRVPQPFGGRYRQIMVYVDPYKLESHQLSLMDVVRSVNESNLILPAGDVQDRQLRLQHLHQQPASGYSVRSTSSR